MCNNEFMKVWSNQKYCGSKAKKIGCGYIAYRNKFKRFNEGKGNKYYSLLPRVKDQIRERYKYTCQICKMRNDLKGFMDIDHKDGDRNNDDVNNVWILCPNCHRIKTIRDRENKN